MIFHPAPTPIHPPTQTHAHLKDGGLSRIDFAQAPAHSRLRQAARARRARPFRHVVCAIPGRDQHAGGDQNGLLRQVVLGGPAAHREGGGGQ